MRVLGDRSTLFKYLSPNVIFVAAAPTDAVPEESALVGLELLSGPVRFVEEAEAASLRS